MKLSGTLIDIDKLNYEMDFFLYQHFTKRCYKKGRASLSEKPHYSNIKIK